MSVEHFPELVGHRAELMVLWQASNAPPDGDPGVLREALLRVACQFHNGHPEHSVTTIRKALIAWSGVRAGYLAGERLGVARGPLAALVKVVVDDGALAIYAVSTEHLSHRLGASKREQVIANGRKVATKNASGTGTWIRVPGGQAITDTQMLRRYDGMLLMKS